MKPIKTTIDPIQLMSSIWTDFERQIPGSAKAPDEPDRYHVTKAEIHEGRIVMTLIPETLKVVDGRLVSREAPSE